MAKLAQGFHLFGTNKVFVRSLVIHKCLFKPNPDEANLISIKRTHKDLDGRLRQEESNIDYAIFPRGGTLHLHDLVLTNSFGITVTFLNGRGEFETFELNSEVEQQPLLEFLTFSNEEVLLLSHLEANLIG